MPARFLLSRKSVELRLSEQNQKIVDTLAKVLDASVMLHDAERREPHLVASASSGWSSQNWVLDRRHSCHLQARINDRWTLSVSSTRRLHPDADSLAKWAADKLAPYLPCRSAAEEPTVPPSRGGGGSGGGAEIGIPVWWARKIDTN